MLIRARLQKVYSRRPQFTIPEPICRTSVVSLATNYTNNTNARTAGDRRFAFCLFTFAFCLFTFCLDPCPILSHACPTGVVGHATHCCYWSYGDILPLSHAF